MISIHGKEVFEFRYGIFMDLGFNPSEAQSLANTHADTHDVRDMLEHGCTHEQAFSILI